MSIRCQSWVYEYSETTGNDRLVLLAIADEADDDGTNAFPGIKRIAHKARVPERTVMRCLERLETNGDLIVHRPDKRGRGRFNTYEVAMKGDTLTPIRMAPKRPQERVPERRVKARKGAPPYVNGHRPIDPGPKTPVLNAPAAETDPAPDDLRAGSEVQETPTDPGTQLLAAVAAAAPACCAHELLADPDQAAGRAALRRRLVALAAQLGDEAAVTLVAGEWPEQVASAMAHANARAMAYLERPSTPAPAWRASRPDPLDGLADAAAAIAERARDREAELADQPRGGPDPEAAAGWAAVKAALRSGRTEEAARP